MFCKFLKLLGDLYRQYVSQVELIALLIDKKLWRQTQFYFLVSMEPRLLFTMFQFVWSWDGT